MPQFMKSSAIALLDGGIESYLLALHGMTLPSTRIRRKQETRYAPILGLFGASVELLVKACLVQIKGPGAMYKDDDVSSGIYRFGTEVLKDLRKTIRDADSSIVNLWEKPAAFEKVQKLLLHYMDKFKLLQELRANGLHAGIGCSRDITVSTANDIYQFIVLLSESKKLKAYLKNIPAPEATVRDREAIIEDLSRRMNNSKNDGEKLSYLRNMYLVLPYIPEIEPEWISAFDKASVLPPKAEDVKYLVQTLSEAHSIYLLKSRGGKEGLPVRIEPGNPNALPIAIQNIKRTLSSIPDQFNNDVLTSNTRIEQSRLDLPIEDFIIDLYVLGLEQSKILMNQNTKLTAQQVWPFVVSAYSTQGSPRPCWFFIRACDELDQLIAFLNRAKDIGNGYLTRRINTVIKCINAIKERTPVNLNAEQDSIFKGVRPYYESIGKIKPEQRQPFIPMFIKKYPLSDAVSAIVAEFVAGIQTPGKVLESILKLDKLSPNDRKVALALLPLCYDNENKNGLIAVLRTEHLSGYISMARKMMFFIDMLFDGPNIAGIPKMEM